MAPPTPIKGSAHSVMVCAIGELLNGLTACDRLEEEDAEVVDVATLRYRVPHCVLRDEVAEGALDVGGAVADAIGDQLGKLRNRNRKFY